MPNISFDISFAAMLACTLFFFFMLLVPGTPSTKKRVREVTTVVKYRDRPATARQRIGQIVLRKMQALRMKVGMAESEKLRQRFVSAGLKGAGPVETYFALRMLGPAAGFLIGSFIPGNTFLWVLGLGAFGYLAPDFWLDHAIKGRRERIRRSIPDAIDLLVICVDAGLGIDQAMLRVGVELSISHPEVNEEFLQINREQRAGKPRIEAWQSMADRTHLPEISAFTSMLVQTEKFGTPIARALSNFAEGVRQKRRQRAEELAAKTTVKMIFPLVLFIFPSMFIVLLAPAILSIGRGLAGLGQ